MPGRRRLTPEARRAEILAAAVDLASRRDLASVPTAEVAAQAGVSEGLLFRYFPTRGDLLLAVVESAADELIASVTSAVGDSPLAVVLAGLETYLDHVEASPASWSVLLRPAQDPAVAAVLARVEQASLELFREAVGADELPAPLVVALSAWMALERRACEAWLDDPAQLSRAALTDLLLGSFLGAVQALQSDPAVRQVLAPLLAQPE